MKFRDEELWNEAVEESPDPFGVKVFAFAKEWAEKMEEKVAKGETVDDCAVVSFDACLMPVDQETYRAIVSILTRTWIHGEEFGKWRI